MNKIIRQEHEIAQGSIQDLANQRDQSLAECILDVEYIALVDVSISMDDRDGEGDSSRWQHMMAALRNLQRSKPGKWLVVEFSSNVEVRPTGIPSPPHGYTDLAAGLHFIKPFDGSVQFYLISDGEPNDKQSAIDAARRFSSRINVICVGDAAGSKFMQELAQSTGGITIDVKEANEKLITEGIKLLMEGR